ncbi:hypothetical protein FDJ19_gp180 [Vibrio phage Ceto]|uniref:Uncharacterized protein n=3 Tax=Ermolyevavirinae TaxID=2732012 RepID=A0A2H5BH71_9CAUD|nr:hypothetical protein FDJ19_gp180 [Vibrio phage Ceto]YP_009621401.1 hypothetical protein FDJ20_gp182 [Vibrio phage Thalassa]YP_010107962.1 hypothetical protein KNV05_gp179 [Vibrio phage River4]AUG85118.1 hypothetical protein CETO_135 [Vibrio phage Ceto]AUG85320.1 hypothetical protein THALASSA_140 [Vibrio phage Thalassa]QKN84776.1 hypothetical protein RIVER4_136 [Vibrio phage River4]
MFTREQKYVVISLRDIREGLDEGQKMALAGLLSKMENHRKARGREPIEAVVIDKNTLGELPYEDGFKIVESAVHAKHQRNCEHTYKRDIAVMGGLDVLTCTKCGHVELE